MVSPCHGSGIVSFLSERQRLQATPTMAVGDACCRYGNLFFALTDRKYINLIVEINGLLCLNSTTVEVTA